MTAQSTESASAPARGRTACRLTLTAFVSFVALMSFVPPAAAQMGSTPAGYKLEPGVTASTIPPALREIGFDQNLNQQLPLDAAFKDETGRDVRLGDFFGRRPVVLALVYFNCPMLCTQVMSGLTSSLGVMSLEPGKDFDVVAVSFDPREKPTDAAEKKQSILERYHHGADPGGWHFLTGEQPSIDRLTKAAGFRYVWDKDTNQFAHPTGVIVVTPNGRVARYLFGVEFGPRDLRLSLVEASQGKIGSVVDTLLLYCYHYDPMTGRYGVVILRTLRAAGAATVLAIVSFIVVMVRRDKSSTRPVLPEARSPRPGA